MQWGAAACHVWAPPPGLSGPPPHIAAPFCDHPLPQYPWSGAEVMHGRRDKRKGSHRGSVARTERGPCIS